VARRDIFRHRGLRIPETQRQSASALDTVWFRRNPIMGLPSLQLVLDTQIHRKYVPIYESEKNRHPATDFLLGVASHFMKTRYILLGLLAVATAVFASADWPWDNTKSATISLPEAYDRALIALGSETNQLHCISAEVSSKFRNDGGWRFVFYYTNTPPKFKTVYVDFVGNQTHMNPNISR
jgi:hypothetical protein